MKQIWGYARTSTHEQDVDKFKEEILEYGKTKGFSNIYFILEQISGKKDWKERKIGELLNFCNPDDVIIVPELSRLGRSISMIYSILEECQRKNIEVHCIKENLIVNNNNDIATKVLINTFALAAEIECGLISKRTAEALAAKKASGMKLGRPKCGVGKSRLDKHYEEIKAMRNIKSPYEFIGKKYGVAAITVKRWCEKHLKNDA